MKNTQKINNVLTSVISGGIVAVLVSMLVLNANPQSTPSTSSEEQTISEKEFLSEEDLVIDVVEKATPSVVSIIITKDVPVVEQYFEDFGSPFGGSQFGMPGFNFQIPQYRNSGETEKKEVGGGSGFIVSEDGFIVTNKHVVDDEDAEYTVFTSDGEKYDAKVIDRDSLNDIAVIKIEKEGLAFLEFGDSDNIKVGQTVLAIGNPLLEFDNSVSKGVVSGLSRSITAGGGVLGKSENLEGVIQTDAAINPGNSGGPLLNILGEVIGVNVAVANGENIGFSIPANSVKRIVESIKENGRIIRPFLGIRYVQITESLKEKNNLSVDYGVLISRGETMEDLAVIPGSSADKAGLVENDIILEVDEEKLDGKKSLANIVADKRVGDQIKLKILHKGEEKEILITLKEAEEK